MSKETWTNEHEGAIWLRRARVGRPCRGTSRATWVTIVACENAMRLPYAARRAKCISHVQETYLGYSSGNGQNGEGPMELTTGSRRDKQEENH